MTHETSEDPDFKKGQTTALVPRDCERRTTVGDFASGCVTGGAGADNMSISKVLYTMVVAGVYFVNFFAAVG